MAHSGGVLSSDIHNPQDEYKFIQRIGSGSFGDVYKAKKRNSNGELAAIKVIKLDPGDNFAIIQQEIQMLKDCRHPNIVMYYGSYVWRDRVFISMEYCGGGSLRAIYRVTGPLSELQIAYMCRETLTGLSYLHSMGKLHRDIKGANILLTECGDVKIADFGVSAQITATINYRKTSIGTPYWMAPEVAAVERIGGYNQLCDIWAVGITAIELAELQPPMSELIPVRALFLMSQPDFKPPQLKEQERWTNLFHAFLTLALTKDPKNRPQAVNLLQHAFFKQEMSKRLAIELLQKYSNQPSHSSSQELDENMTLSNVPQGDRRLLADQAQANHVRPKVIAGPSHRRSRIYDDSSTMDLDADDEPMSCGGDSAKSHGDILCLEMDAKVLTEQSNPILTAIIHGMRSTERSTSNNVRLTATQALLNSLTMANFDIDNERTEIMKVVCEATQSSDTRISVAALQCLGKILSLYYQHMEPYMREALLPITLEAMKSDVDEVALQGIKFWTKVCGQEFRLAVEEAVAADAGPPAQTSKFYARGALENVAPVLIQKLLKKHDSVDELERNPAENVSSCLMYVSNCCGDEIVPHVLPFINTNINNKNWRYREAALKAFGSIVGGLDANTLKPLVQKAMPTLIEAMYDSSVSVRDTAAWTFGRVCEKIPEAAINDMYLEPVIEGLLNGLKAEPLVAARVCWAFTVLAEAAYEAECGDSIHPDTYCMSKYFECIIQRLLETAERQDAAQHNLRSTVYRTMIEMVENSPADCLVTLQKTTEVTLKRLQRLLKMENQLSSQADRLQFNDLQRVLCATLRSVLRKVTPKDNPRIWDNIMNELLNMFPGSVGEAGGVGDVGGVQEGALRAVSSLVEVLGENFLRYMDGFKRYLYAGLKNHQEHQVCIAAVRLTGVICRALNSKVLPYCDDIIYLLFANLEKPSIHRSVIPRILSVFGDIALSIGPYFAKYFDVVMQMLLQASNAQVDRNDYDTVEYLKELHESVLKAFTGFIQGLKGDHGEGQGQGQERSNVALVEPHLPVIVAFMTQVAMEPARTHAHVTLVAALARELCAAFGPRVLPLLETRPLLDLLQAARRSHKFRTAVLATVEIRKRKQHHPPH